MQDRIYRPSRPSFRPARVQERPHRSPQRPPTRTNRPRGNPRSAPKVPVSGKERRRMLKATTHRLAIMLGIRCSEIIASGAEELFAMIGTQLGNGYGSGAGEARRLVMKLTRLRVVGG